MNAIIKLLLSTKNKTQNSHMEKILFNFTGKAQLGMAKQ